ncbi:MAG: HAMP domain-containing histidine kinase [Butyrivibrio sp.]|nr:HAMP domain-containing histidine kinase [Butyrivibrio sp.]
MVRQLRKKFIVTAMSALLVILVVLIAAINIFNYVQFVVSTDTVLDELASQGGSFSAFRFDGEKPVPPERQKGSRPLMPQTGTPGIIPDRRGDDLIRYSRAIERPFNTRYFSVFYRRDEAGETEEAASPGSADTYSVSGVDISHIAALTEEDAKAYGDIVIQRVRNQGRGAVGTYRYLVHPVSPDTQNEQASLQIIFVDCSDNLYAARQLLLSSVVIGAFALLAMFALVWLFSGHAVSPVAESVEKQKRFITDAGHELKTPLAVIRADIDVLELESGENEWTRSVKGQVARMAGLVADLLTISRMEEEGIKTVFSPQDLSAIVLSCRDSFLPVTEEKNLVVEADVTEQIKVNGDGDSLMRLITLLTDNAVKYCAREGTIRIRLLREGKKAVFEISNPCEVMPEGDLDRLFERFYRAEKSRSRKSGGYGIGLSAAKAITEAHGGAVKAEREDERTIRFRAEIPLL